MKTTTKTSKSPRQVRPERIVNDLPRTFTEADFPVGSVAHQGDVILVRLAGLPDGAESRNNRQMAIGETRGSRHMLAIGAAFDCPLRNVSQAIGRLTGSSVGEQYIGPVFQTVAGLASLLHPEHGHHHYEGKMTIACVYQRNLDAEEREHRVLD